MTTCFVSMWMVTNSIANAWLPINANKSKMVQYCQLFQNQMRQQQVLRYKTKKFEKIDRFGWVCLRHSHFMTLNPRPVWVKTLGGLKHAAAAAAAAAATAAAAAALSNCFNKPPKGRLHSDLSQWAEGRVHLVAKLKTFCFQHPSAHLFKREPEENMRLQWSRYCHHCNSFLF